MWTTCLSLRQRGLFGLPAEMGPPAVGMITPGCTLFLANMSERVVFGIFEVCAMTTWHIWILRTTSDSYDGSF